MVRRACDSGRWALNATRRCVHGHACNLCHLISHRHPNACHLKHAEKQKAASLTKKEKNMRSVGKRLLNTTSLSACCPVGCAGSPQIPANPQPAHPSAGDAAGTALGGGDSVGGRPVGVPPSLTGVPIRRETWTRRMTPRYAGRCRVGTGAMWRDSKGPPPTVPGRSAEAATAAVRRQVRGQQAAQDLSRNSTSLRFFPAQRPTLRASLPAQEGPEDQAPQGSPRSASREQRPRVRNRPPRAQAPLTPETPSAGSPSVPTGNKHRVLITTGI